jgi:hypothetical protein
MPDGSKPNANSPAYLAYAEFAETQVDAPALKNSRPGTWGPNRYHQLSPGQSPAWPARIHRSAGWLPPSRIARRMP